MPTLSDKPNKSHSTSMTWRYEPCAISTRRYLTTLLAGHRVRSSPESGDKVVRAEPFAARVNVGNVVMVRADWNKTLIDEMRLFPNGAFDDTVDGCSRAFSRLIGNGGWAFG